MHTILSFLSVLLILAAFSSARPISDDPVTAALDAAERAVGVLQRFTLAYNGSFANVDATGVVRFGGQPSTNVTTTTLTGNSSAIAKSVFSMSARHFLYVDEESADLGSARLLALYSGSTHQLPQQTLITTDNALNFTVTDTPVFVLTRAYIGRLQVQLIPTSLSTVQAAMIPQCLSYQAGVVAVSACLGDDQALLDVQLV